MGSPCPVARRELGTVPVLADRAHGLASVVSQPGAQTRTDFLEPMYWHRIFLWTSNQILSGYDLDMIWTWPGYDLVMIWLWDGYDLVVRWLLMWRMRRRRRHAALIKSRGPHQVGKHTFTSNLYIYTHKLSNISYVISWQLYIHNFMVSGVLTTSQPLHRSGRVRLRSVVSDGSLFRSKSNG